MKAEFNQEAIAKAQKILPDKFRKISLEHPAAAAQIISSVILPASLNLDQQSAVSRVLHFGSTEEGEYKETSDIDVLVVLKPDGPDPDALFVELSNKTDIQRKTLGLRGRRIHYTIVNEDQLANPRLDYEKMLSRVAQTAPTLKFPVATTSSAPGRSSA